MDRSVQLCFLVISFVKIFGFPNPDPCWDAATTVTPRSCYDVSCYHGSCSIGFSPQLEVVVECRCEPGWHGVQCDVCDNEYDDIGATSRTTTTTDDDTYTGSEQSPPGQVTTCLGVPVVPVTPSPCHGLSCLHGQCINVSTDDVIAYQCDCDQGWIGLQCELCCDLACNHGNCHVNYDTNAMYCVCHNSSFTRSSNCTQLAPTDPPDNIPSTFEAKWFRVKVGVKVLGGVTLSLLLFIMLCYFWQRKFPFMLKIAYFFKKYDDSEHTFDVFISYRSSTDDEEFVINKLHPKLEQMKLRVCVHYKDFTAGSTIAENIINAVEGSCRTLLVISPDYCTGEWPRFEVQAAQKEMLKHRHRIVPVIFKDINKARAAGEVDKILMHIIDSVTYIKWPGSKDAQAERKFWNQLRLAMPKVCEGKQATKCHRNGDNDSSFI